MKALACLVARIQPGIAWSITLIAQYIRDSEGPPCFCRRSKHWMHFSFCATTNGTMTGSSWKPYLSLRCTPSLTLQGLLATGPDGRQQCLWKQWSAQLTTLCKTTSVVQPPLPKRIRLIEWTFFCFSRCGFIFPICSLYLSLLWRLWWLSFSRFTSPHRRIHCPWHGLRCIVYICFMSCAWPAAGIPS